MLVHMSGAKRVLEIGMFTGYGALSMAEGLPEDGRLVACELEPYLRDFSRPLFDKSPHGSKISVRTGSAMDTLQVRPDPSAQKLLLSACKHEEAVGSLKKRNAGLHC